jgi:hypothetical protein
LHWDEVQAWLVGVEELTYSFNGVIITTAGIPLSHMMEKTNRFRIRLPRRECSFRTM